MLALIGEFEHKKKMNMFVEKNSTQLKKSQFSAQFFSPNLFRTTITNYFPPLFILIRIYRVHFCFPFQLSWYRVSDSNALYPVPSSQKIIPSNTLLYIRNADERCAGRWVSFY